jgi:hypothetical protein
MIAGLPMAMAFVPHGGVLNPINPVVPDEPADDEEWEAGAEGGGEAVDRGDGFPAPPKKTRYDSSLGLLTQKFTDLIKESPQGLLDLNQVRGTHWRGGTGRETQAGWDGVWHSWGVAGLS